MGGRGASLGVSVNGNIYASQYRTVLASGNIKFVEKREGSTESLLETMTARRVYVEINSRGKPGAIHYFDKKNMRVKTIDLDHRHQGRKPHSHRGYYHDVYVGGMSQKEKRMIDRVYSLWETKKKSKG